MRLHCYKRYTRAVSKRYKMDVDEVMQNWSDIESKENEESEEYDEKSEESENSSLSEASSENEQEEEGVATAQDSWTEVIGL